MDYHVKFDTNIHVPLMMNCNCFDFSFAQYFALWADIWKTNNFPISLFVFSAN